MKLYLWESFADDYDSCDAHTIILAESAEQARQVFRAKCADMKAAFEAWRTESRETAAQLGFGEGGRSFVKFWRTSEGEELLVRRPDEGIIDDSFLSAAPLVIDIETPQVVLL